MFRSVAYSVGLHLFVVVLLAADYAFFSEPDEVLSNPIIPVELTSIGPETNQATAGEKEDVPPPPQASAPDTPPPPPPPPPSAAPEPPPLPDTNALVREEPEPAPAPEPEPEPQDAVTPPSPRPKVEERAENTVAPKETVAEEAEKLAALKPLPEPEPPKPEPAPEKKPEPKPEKTTSEKEPAPAPPPAPKKAEKKGLDLNQLAAKIDRMADRAERPRPQDRNRRRISDIRIGEGGVSQNRLNRKLSVSEVDLLRHRLKENWSPNHGAPGIEKMQVVIRIFLKPDGTLAAPPKVIDGFDAGQSDDVFGAFSDSAVRAVYKSQPLPLPPEKFEDWQEIEINFNLRDM